MSSIGSRFVALSSRRSLLPSLKSRESRVFSPVPSLVPGQKNKTPAVPRPGTVDRGLSTWATLFLIGSPDGIRIRVSAVRGRCPRPLDDGAVSLREPGWGRRTRTLASGARTRRPTTRRSPSGKFYYTQGACGCQPARCGPGHPGPAWIGLCLLGPPAPVTVNRPRRPERPQMPCLAHRDRSPRQGTGPAKRGSADRGARRPGRGRGQDPPIEAGREGR